MTPRNLLHVVSRIILAILRIPGLISLSILITLYAITEQRFSEKFFVERYTWQPAFPSSWRSLLLLVLIVPIFSFIQILRLLAYRFLLPLLIDRWNKAFGTGDPSQEGYVMFNRDDSADRPTLPRKNMHSWKMSKKVPVSVHSPDQHLLPHVESHSSDSSPELLQALDADLELLGVPRRILTGDTAVTKPDDLRGNQRIEFLAATRNRALEPLTAGGYDRVVFSNDVFIEPESFVELLETNNGDYDMACGLDMGHFG